MAREYGEDRVRPAYLDTFQHGNRTDPANADLPVSTKAHHA